MMPPGVGVYLCRMDGYGGVFERTVQLRREYSELIHRLNHMYDRLRLIPDKGEKSLRNAEWIRERDRSVACMIQVICKPTHRHARLLIVWTEVLRMIIERVNSRQGV